ncbi:MAG: low molecular weight phosphotyrosine protein phosphatase [Clostridiales bacterium]|nr:low molecular weight phosphotyrosine protein phosphatase [Clostridiales bacterium]MBR2223739.1 low molecular weight phosphotyrosine protein phosphatase [Christensenellaceae bacterium]MBR3843309.1 low molecular weight phosphotyrosine protein phosphatase [Christensenellaceae bacterium]
MHKILFVCLGNICRSPMAEFIMKKMVSEAGLDDQFEIASAATSTEQLHNPVYPPARELLEANGMDCSKKHARQISDHDFNYYDLILGMDESNIRNLKRRFGESEKIKMLLSYTGDEHDIADPWYYGNFDRTYREITEGCTALLNHLTK